jgi:hypothetical protein
MAIEIGPNGLTIGSRTYADAWDIGAEWYYRHVASIEDGAYLISGTDDNNNVGLWEDANDYGWWAWGSTTFTDRPSSYCVMLHARDSGQPIQWAFGDSGSGKMFVRRQSNGVNRAWTQI